MELNLTIKSMALCMLLCLFYNYSVGQELYLKTYLDTLITQIDGEYAEYNYHDNWDLDFIHEYDGNNQSVYFYTNDTLMRSYAHGINLFEYFQDSVIKFRVEDGDTSVNYKYIMDDNKVQHGYGHVFNYSTRHDFFWLNENLDSTHYYQGDEIIVKWFYTYSDNILNPRYNESKYLRNSYKSSRYYIEEFIPDEGNHIFYEIIETIYNYPVRVKVYKNGQHRRNITYEYYIVSGIDDHINPDIEVLDVKYYNILGQEIQKPKSGFYIEVKQTSHGNQSKKYFIQ